ncbi:MAG TPA: hypothetical protein VFN20_00520 [Candidatus Acidoferrum sp.]|nr:hypothetical protein [Candidatus Acidoferrum sp.]
MKRPWAVTILGLLFIVAGTAGLLYHAANERTTWALTLISLIRIAAIVGGIFLLLGHSWARWLLVAWLAFHVVVSAFHSVGQVAAHAVLLAVVAYFLFKDRAANYFRPA